MTFDEVSKLLKQFPIVNRGSDEVRRTEYWTHKVKNGHLVTESRGPLCGSGLDDGYNEIYCQTCYARLAYSEWNGLPGANHFPPDEICLDAAVTHLYQVEPLKWAACEAKKS